MDSEEELIPDIFSEEVQEEDGLFEHFEIVAAKGQGLLRVDKFITNLRPMASRTKIQAAADADCLHVNGKPVKSSYKVKPFDKISLMLPYPPPPELKAENIPIDIIYEDDDLLMVNKSAEMVVHPSIGHHSGTLIHAVLWHFEHLPQPAIPQNIPRPGLVHRIDKGTSGLLVLAKNDYAMAFLAKQFFDRTTSRLYYAIVWGEIKQDHGTITGNIGRSTRDRKIFMVYPEGDAGKHAVTHYRVLEYYGIATLIECKLETGRTHQIRVHLKHIGHPLIGDSFYGGDKLPPTMNTQKRLQFANNCLHIMRRQALHAKTLGFIHPSKGIEMAFDSNLPEDFMELREKLQKYKAAEMAQ
jgi:23S rRNA pseudouridine1911/1915/1917 synthase